MLASDPRRRVAEAGAPAPGGGGAGGGGGGGGGLVASRTIRVDPTDPAVQLRAGTERWYLDPNEDVPRPAVLDLHMCRLRSLAHVKLNQAEADIVRIDLSLNYFVDLPDLSPCAGALRSLDLGLNQLASLGDNSSERLRLPHLRFLSLARNRLDDLPATALSTCTHLVELDLSGNRLYKLDGVSCLSNLVVLNVKGNELESLAGLEVLTRLRELDASQNRLEEALPLATMTSLQAIDLAHNRLDDLDETQGVILCLTKLETLRLVDNPITAERNYRMRILENESITKLDNVRVASSIREQWKQADMVRDLDEVVEATTLHYMQWIESERERKNKAIAGLRRREVDIEESFAAYRAAMEAELEECINYVQELAHNPAAREASYLASDHGQTLWRGRLAEAEQVRKTVYAREQEDVERKHDEMAALESDSVEYLAKLKQLSKQRPSVWRDLKSRETRLRGEEEERQALVAISEAADRAATRERLSKRAEDRNELLLASANQLDVRLRG